MSQLYTIQESTLKEIAGAIRNKFNFTDDIPTTQFPMYISSGDAKQFWVTHFNTIEPVEGSGVIYTKEDQLIKRGWHDYFAFSPVEGITNGYQITDRLNWRVTGDRMAVSFSNVDFTNSTMSDGLANIKIPTFETLEDGTSEAYTNTFYESLTGFNGYIRTGEAHIFTSPENWSNGNPGWSSIVILRKGAYNSDNYYVVNTLYYKCQNLYNNYYVQCPIQVLQDRVNNVDYSPPAAQASEIYLDFFEEFFGADYQTGDLILTANGQDANLGIFNLRAGSIASPDIHIPENGFIYAINAGNNYPSLGIDLPNYTSPAGIMAWQRTANWQLGEQILFSNIDIISQEIPTTTPLEKWYNQNYICTASYDILKQNETISIDGYFDEDAWSYGGWIVGDKYCGGVYQETNVPDNIQMIYKYKLMSDDTYLYGGVVSPYVPNPTSATEPSIVRLWIRNNSIATIYTHIIDIRYTSTGAIIQLYKNTSLTENEPEIITSPEGYEIAWYVGTDKSHIEFKVKLSDLNIDETFEYYTSYGTMINNKQYTLYAQSIQEGATHSEFLPFNKWDEQHAAKFTPANENITSDEMITILSELI